MTTEEGLAKYRELYAKKTGVELSYAEAEAQATRLLTAYRVITGPMPKEWWPRYLEVLKEHLDKETSRNDAKGLHRT